MPPAFFRFRLSFLTAHWGARTTNRNARVYLLAHALLRVNLRCYNGHIESPPGVRASIARAETSRIEIEQLTASERLVIHEKN